MAAPTASSRPVASPSGPGTSAARPADVRAASQRGPSGPDYLPSLIPHDLLAGVVAAHRRLLDLVATVDDDILRRPSALPGWSVAHLLTHLARNADSHSGMVEAAAAGEVRPQYPGGQRQRNDDIDAGRDVPAQTARADIATAVARLEQAWDAVPVDAWRTGRGWIQAYGATTLADLVFLRWREVEIHLVDLALADVAGGPRWADLTAAYVDVEWARTVGVLPERLPSDLTVLLAPGDRPSTAVGRGDTVIVIDAPTLPTLAWLTGREPGAPDWPELTAWS